MGRFTLLSGKKGFEMGMAAFALLALGGSAYYMSANKSTNVKTGASNVIESAQGTLVKKDTPAFSPCKDVTTPYALIGAQPTTPVNAKGGTQPTPRVKATPGTTPVATTEKKVATPPACTPLTIPSDFAESLVGQKVIVSGTFKDGVFYGTTIAATVSPDASVKPKATTPVKPTAKP
jgi:hypothetical protein